MVTSTGSASPCGACKFLRRKCASDCIFAPYFCSEQGPARFASIHKIFGASNVSKLLMQVPLSDRSEAVLTIAYEAEARIRDPIYGCVAHIFALQQQVATLQAQLLQIKAQMAHNSADPRLLENYCPPHFTGGLPQLSYPQHFIGCMDQNGNGLPMDDGMYGQDLASQSCIKKRSSHTELNELQALAHRMMKN